MFHAIVIGGSIVQFTKNTTDRLTDRITDDVLNVVQVTAGGEPRSPNTDLDDDGPSRRRPSRGRRPRPLPITPTDGVDTPPTAAIGGDTRNEPDTNVELYDDATSSRLTAAAAAGSDQDGVAVEGSGDEVPVDGSATKNNNNIDMGKEDGGTSDLDREWKKHSLYSYIYIYIKYIYIYIYIV